MRSVSGTGATGQGIPQGKGGGRGVKKQCGVFGLGVPGVWKSWGVGHLAYGVRGDGVIGVQGTQTVGYGETGVWCIWNMGYLVYGGTEVWGTRIIGCLGYGQMEVGELGVWGNEIVGHLGCGETWGMKYSGYEALGVQGAWGIGKWGYRVPPLWGTPDMVYPGYGVPRIWGTQRIK